MVIYFPSCISMVSFKYKQTCLSNKIAACIPNWLLLATLKSTCCCWISKFSPKVTVGIKTHIIVKVDMAHADWTNVYLSMHYSTWFNAKGNRWHLHQLKYLLVMKYPLQKSFEYKHRLYGICKMVLILEILKYFWRN